MLKRTVHVFVSLVVITSLAFAADDAKKMTIEDALGLLEVSAPQWSPDSKWLAVTVSEWNRKDVRRDSHIYLVPATGAGPPIKLTNGERGETQPQWSPDSTRIACLANRDTPRS
ncbi:hypothetical protein BH18ACI2_BH18ACI2_29640 [soil metagenome]